MIKSKDDLKYYLLQDKLALGKSSKKPKIFSDEIWKFQILLRKCEYYENIDKKSIYKYLYKYLFKRKSIKLGFSIPLNTFAEGLSIAHYGTIVINGNAKIGRNCRIHEGVTIGATGGSGESPIIGENVFIGSGAKILGNIKVADNVAIGANSVVVKDVTESGITVAGTPAKKVSDNDSSQFLNKYIRSDL